MPDCIFSPINSVHGSSVVVVRVSGGNYQVMQALNALGIVKFNKIVDDKHYVAKLPVVKLCKIFKNGELLDETLITLFTAPHSFTGETVAEIALHASSYILASVIEILSGLENCRAAKPGEFSYRAFINGKMDLIKAESINDIVKSQNQLSHKLAIKSYDGHTSKCFQLWKDELIEALSLLTCYIDFAEDEDINDSFEQKVTGNIAKICTQMTDFLSGSVKANSLKDGIKCCIFGPPNAGKSSFLNKICSRDIAIVSEIAGTTRDVIEFNANIGQLSVSFYDTAGIRSTQDVIELEGIKRAKITLEQSQVRIFIVDATNYKQANDFLNYISPQTIVIINKSDLANDTKFAYDYISKLTSANNIFAISIYCGDGWLEFMKFFENFLHQNFASLAINSFALNLRQEAKIKLCISSLQNMSDISMIELFAEDLRRAIHILDEVVGVIDSEDILDKMFGTFCIGK